MNNLPVYVISLSDDICRRTQLKKNFGQQYDLITIVDAVDFRGVRNKEMTPFTPKQLKSKKKPLTDTETACAMSHLKVLKLFLKSRQERCIILEDDVIGSTKSLIETRAIISKLPNDFTIILGGQEGLKNTNFAYGYPIADNLWRVPHISLNFLSRACCYAVSRSAAVHILEQQSTYLDRADHWAHLLSKYKNIYFSNIFQHPVDLTNSHLEKERLSRTGNSIFKKVLNDGITFTIQNNISKVLLSLSGRVTKLERVYKT